MTGIILTPPLRTSSRPVGRASATSAICPTCHILLVETKDNSFANLLAGEDWATSHAGYVSNSWAGGEFSSETSSSYDGHFNKPGVVIIGKTIADRMFASRRSSAGG